MLWIRRHWMLLCIVIFGCILRITNLNWDDGGRLHPDEALIANGALSIQFFSHLFPGFHDYNGFSVYLLKLASLIITYITTASWWSNTPEGITIVGRFLSATLSTMSIILIYLLGLRLWNKTTGIYAAILFAATPLSIQLAHFYTTESILIFTFLILVHGVVSYVRKPDAHSLVCMAIPMGILLATKNTSYLFALIPLLAILTSQKHLHRIFESLSLWGGISITTFFLASPYSFLDWTGYMERSKYLQEVVTGKLLMDWTLQFQQTNGLFWIPTIVTSFGFVALLGFVGSIDIIIHRTKTQKTSTLLAVWSLGFLLFLTATYLKFTRYAAPLLPLYALFGANFLSRVYTTRTGRPFVLLCISLQILSGILFFSIYTTRHTSLQASDWIRTYMPDGSMILTEEWNSIIRFYRPEFSMRKYSLASFNFYTLPDDDAKIHRLSSILAHTNYIILESPKVKNTILNQSHRYPKTSQWYRNLDAGNLGFVKVGTFASYPRLGPFIFPDDHMEETYTVFDHPTVTIYMKGSPNSLSPTTSIQQQESSQ